MDPQIFISIGVVAAVVLALSLFRASPDLVLLGGLCILLVSGVLEPGEALAGFANEGLAAVGVLYVVAEGLRQTGGANFVGRLLFGNPKSISSAQARITAPTALASAFLNNTPVVAMLLPVIHDWARKQRLSVSQLMLPLSYAAILGGLCTLIGTSTTLVIDGLLFQYTKNTGMPGRHLAMFEIGQIGLPVALVGLLYILLFSRKLLPDRKPAITPLDDPREYTVEMLVESGSTLAGMTIEEAGLRHLPGMYLMEIDREGHVMAAVPSDEVLQGNDRLIFVGVIESVVDLQKISGLTPRDRPAISVGQPSLRTLPDGGSRLDKLPIPENDNS